MQVSCRFQCRVSLQEHEDLCDALVLMRSEEELKDASLTACMLTAKQLRNALRSEHQKPAVLHAKAHMMASNIAGAG